MNRTFLIQAASSYAASIARVVSWMIVAAVVYRGYGASELAILMLLRGTVGLLSYANLGLMPTLVHLLSRPLPAEPIQTQQTALEYARGETEAQRLAPNRIFATAFVLMLFAGIVAFGCATLYANNIESVHRITSHRAGLNLRWVALFMAGGVILRTVSDVFGARLHASGRLFTDNLCLVVGEMLFVLLACGGRVDAEGAALTFAIGSFLVLVLRGILCDRDVGGSFGHFEARLVRPLVAGGALVLLSQLADWLYAPANQVLIDRFLGTREIATYVPAIQVDAALLLLVAGLSTVLLPRAAAAFHSKDVDTLRGYYVTGTVFSIAILALGATFVCLASDWLFRIWFKDPLPATQAILPLVMIHTVIGGSASIGRSVLFGIGAIKPYAIAAIVGGIANVVLAIVFLTTTDLGLRGIIYATIVTVTVRCLIWLPWYTLRTIGKCGEVSGA